MKHEVETIAGIFNRVLCVLQRNTRKFQTKLTNGRWDSHKAQGWCEYRSNRKVPMDDKIRIIDDDQYLLFDQINDESIVSRIVLYCEVSLSWLLLWVFCWFWFFILCREPFLREPGVTFVFQKKKMYSRYLLLLLLFNRSARNSTATNQPLLKTLVHW